ncbi:MAG TPA: hypothetical protein DEO56_11430, partial [Nitrosomonas nitrosa]|nr:hypothetical protein [Nitrosomonas nitrosa]
DHLAMRNVAQKYYPDDYDRQLLFVILNAGNKEEIKGEINITGSHMDIAPTLLHLMGVKHDRQFLAGNNLINVTQQPSVDILSSTQRLNTLRYINKHLLTGLNNSLCESDYLVNIHDDIIRIGDHGITMHLSGQPVAQESLGFSHAILAIFNGRKEMEHTLTVNLENLHFALHQHWGSPFLLIARADYLPAFIKTGREQNDEISVLWKKPNGEIDYLGGNQDPAYLKIKNPGCPRQPAKNDHTNEIKAPIHTLLEICQTDDSGENYIDRETGNIHLPKVAHGNTWYSVVLTQTIADQYGIADLTPLGEIIPSPKSGYCHAYFGNNELIIPSLKSEKQMHIVKLQLIPDMDSQFIITEKIKRY